MNAVEKWRKNQKEKLKKKKKDIDSRMKEKGDEQSSPYDQDPETKQEKPVKVVSSLGDHTKQHVQIYKTQAASNPSSEVSAEIQAKRDLYWEEQRKLERVDPS